MKSNGFVSGRGVELFQKFEKVDIRKNGAGNEIRTRDFNLGKVALYH